MAEHSDTLTIDVDPPIEFKGGKYDALNLREPKAGEMRKANGYMRNGVNVESLSTHMINLVALVSGWPVPAIEELPQGKLQEAFNFLMGFSTAGEPV